MNPLMWIELVQAVSPLVMKLLEVAGPELQALVDKIAAAEPAHRIEIVTAARRVITVVGTK